MNLLNKIYFFLTKFLPILLFFFLIFFEFLPKDNAQAGDFPLNNPILSDSVEDINQVISEMDISTGYHFESYGVCSYYGQHFQNRKTSNGEHFDMNGFTAAHKDLPFGMILKVTNQSNNQSVLVRINDRGPFLKNRIIDLSRNAAIMIDMPGTDDVKLEGFIPGLTPIGNSRREVYYYGFSISKPLVCLPYSFFDIIHKSTDFDEIMLQYIDFMEKYPKSNIYIFVPTDYLNRLDNTGSPVQYILAKIDLDREPFVDRDVAQDNK